MSRACRGCGCSFPVSGEHRFYHSNKCRAKAASRRKPERSPQDHRESHLRRRYGLTTEQYEAMLRGQGGGCALCGRTDKKRLAVDHDHATGRIRGLLCTRCNLLCGWFEATGIDKLVVYLG